jgi:GTPase SAR1 family protein
MGTASHPVVYAINTRVWLPEIARHTGRSVTVADIPDEVLQHFADLGVDYLWLLGVWRTGAAGREVSLHNEQWRQGYRETLGSTLRDEDICGSPFAIAAYSVDERLGGDGALALLRRRLHARGMRLMLDFMPNHTAIDHPWVSEHPEFYIQGSAADAAEKPFMYRRVSTRAGERFLAHGRDPYSGGWPDTLQLNYRHADVHEAMQQQLLAIARRCDGLRCDMAMLILPSVVEQTWGSLCVPADTRKATHRAFWPAAIDSVRGEQPDFVFIAEVYWGREWELQQQGFDYTYDKLLYDHLTSRDPRAARERLAGDYDFQWRMVRFLENHDEVRAASVFPPDVHRAAAVVTFASPGMRLFHDGELEGRRVKTSIHLNRRPDEPRDPELSAFYERLLRVLSRDELRSGRCRILECRPAGSNATSEQFIACAWQGGTTRLVVAVNYGPARAQCFVPLPFQDIGAKQCVLRDLLGPYSYDRTGGELRSPGLFLDLPAWGYHIFELVEQQLAERVEAASAAQAPGVRVRHVLPGHQSCVNRIAWSADGQRLASGSNDRTLRIWDAVTGRPQKILRAASRALAVAWSRDGKRLAGAFASGEIRVWDTDTWTQVAVLVGHANWVNAVQWSPADPQLLISASADQTLRLWRVDATPREIRWWSPHRNNIFTVCFSSDGATIASGSADRRVVLSNCAGEVLAELEGHTEQVLAVAWRPESTQLASASLDQTVRLWDAAAHRETLTLERHTDHVRAVAFSNDGALLATKSADGTVKLWRTDDWKVVADIAEPAGDPWLPGLAFHPTQPAFASLGDEDTIIRLWDIDLPQLHATDTAPDIRHTTAKIVLVGNQGVGKTGLGWRLTQGQYRETDSTHGEQFWVFNALGTCRADGTQCEAVLWDFAGQADYRVIHALFLDDADLALVLFDPADSRDPMQGVDYWLNQLQVTLPASNAPPERRSRRPIILVGARIDRGAPRMTGEEIDTFCRERGISGKYVGTSARSGEGLDELLERMKAQIRWDEKTTIVTSTTFKRIKDYVLYLKSMHEPHGSPERREVIVDEQELLRRLERDNPAWAFSHAELRSALTHLANYGYVRVLLTSGGKRCVLLLPEVLNNLASSLVLEARRSEKGLGSLDEKRLFSAQYPLRELDNLPPEERDILLDATVLLFLAHNVCFRQTDPLSGRSFLVFPELMNLSAPIDPEAQPVEDGVAYTVTGATQNVYAALVVLLGYTSMFKRKQQWRGYALYETAEGALCGFRQEAEREGEIDFVLRFGKGVGQPVRTFFQGLFESLLDRPNLTVFRLEPIVCSHGHTLPRSTVRERIRAGKPFVHCDECGARSELPKAEGPMQLTQSERNRVKVQQRVATQRSAFEQALLRLHSYAEGRRLRMPSCFISYAWGDSKHEHWVETQLATDLQKAGVDVILDRWENRIGANLSRFIERIKKSDVVVIVGTPRYVQKYENTATATGFFVAAEMDLINSRLTRTEAEKETVLPVLLAGDQDTSFTPLLQNRLCADFRDEQAYFTTAFDLILSMFRISPREALEARLNEPLRSEA